MVETLPAPIQKIAAEVLQHVESAIYSNADNERLPAAEQAQLAEVLGRVRPGRADLSELQPWFQVVRRQQATLERMEQHVSEMQGKDHGQKTWKFAMVQKIILCLDDILKSYSRH